MLGFGGEIVGVRGPIKLMDTKGPIEKRHKLREGKGREGWRLENIKGWLTSCGGWVIDKVITGTIIVL